MNIFSLLKLGSCGHALGLLWSVVCSIPGQPEQCSEILSHKTILELLVPSASFPWGWIPGVYPSFSSFILAVEAWVIDLRYFFSTRTLAPTYTSFLSLTFLDKLCPVQRVF